jgi:hypothetical protein
MPIKTAVVAKPNLPIATAQSGVKISPPMLAPLNAILSAFGRSLSNHGATIALIAAPVVAAEPAPLTAAIGNSCQAAAALP